MSKGKETTRKALILDSQQRLEKLETELIKYQSELYLELEKGNTSLLSTYVMLTRMTYDAIKRESAHISYQETILNTATNVFDTPKLQRELKEAKKEFDKGEEGLKKQEQELNTLLKNPTIKEESKTVVKEKYDEFCKNYRNFITLSDKNSILEAKLALVEEVAARRQAQRKKDKEKVIASVKEKAQQREKEAQRKETIKKLEKLEEELRTSTNILDGYKNMRDTALQDNNGSFYLTDSNKLVVNNKDVEYLDSTSYFIQWYDKWTLVNEEITETRMKLYLELDWTGEDKNIDNLKQKLYKDLDLNENYYQALHEQTLHQHLPLDKDIAYRLKFINEKLLRDKEELDILLKAENPKKDLIEEKYKDIDSYYQELVKWSKKAIKSRIIAETQVDLVTNTRETVVQMEQEFTTHWDHSDEYSRSREAMKLRIMAESHEGLRKHKSTKETDLIEENDALYQLSLQREQEEKTKREFVTSWENKHRNESLSGEALEELRRGLHKLRIKENHGDLNELRESRKASKETSPKTPERPLATTTLKTAEKVANDSSRHLN